MPYPDQIDQFTEKLNKKSDGSVYTVEEELPINGGVYQGFLGHDNITNSTIRVYTGPQFTGIPVTNFIVSIPSETPWKRSIKIFAQTETVYVTYETPGDMVEAEDVNNLQDSLIRTQAEIERYKATGIIDGGGFIREEV
ncbi:hypothetical protein [Desulfosporosinus youngiae]|uniref:Phosphoglucomutase n=1 Tax=Desulfosporosinus youngiae DSM 17734 TaxID=768710 RepID=H5XZT2_9FIRM|nr:hypothetical protein [Desulfosporosinus youngiae]EHQ92128.1 hypothetical protein DesyoDRAFT_5197 [Desulfosporosinus youngiae DSM 17734]